MIGLFGKIFHYSEARIYFEYKNFVEFESNYKNDKEYLYTKLYCNTIYQYYKNNKTIELDNKLNYKFDYGYWKLKKYGNIMIDDITKNKLPKEIKKDMTWKELFIIIVEKYFYLYLRLEDWFNFNCEKLFENNYYTFNIKNYLVANNMIDDIPDFKHTLVQTRGDIFKTIFNDNIRRT
jgi:hypothetical protein